MQSTGHSCMQERSITSMHESPMTYAIQPTLRSRSGQRRYGVRRVAWKELLFRCEMDGGVVDREGRLPESDGDQPHFAGVVGDVAGGVDAGQSGRHGGVHRDEAVAGELQAPPA